VEFPRGKRYLLKYFDTGLQTMFLKYVYIFGNYTHFSDHTGFKCQKRWCDFLYQRYLVLEKLNREARANMDMVTLAKIESGKYKLHEHVVYK
jgi:hypothetical protein